LVALWVLRDCKRLDLCEPAISKKLFGKCKAGFWDNFPGQMKTIGPHNVAWANGRKQFHEK
jgi:hypothetical protein